MKSELRLLYKLNLDEILCQMGIRRYQLAQDTGITRKTLRELGKRDCRISTLIRICVYLKIELNELITIPPNKKMELTQAEIKYLAENCNHVLNNRMIDGISVRAKYSFQFVNELHNKLELIKNK
jgi:DNA-binding Xre family transcriptional regulator